MADKWLVWGNSGHGRVVADLLQAAGHEWAGFVDRNAVGPDCASQESLRDALEGKSGLPFGASYIALGIGDNEARWQAWMRIRPELSPSVVHPAAWLSDSVCLGPGSVVMPRAVLHTRVTVGSAVIINTGAVIEHDGHVGDGAHISPGAIITGNVSIGDRAWVGAGAIILPGVSIGARAVIGAGAVVLANVPAGVTVIGNPARPMPQPT